VDRGRPRGPQPLPAERRPSARASGDCPRRRARPRRAVPQPRPARARPARRSAARGGRRDAARAAPERPLPYRPFKLVAVAPRARGRGVDARRIEFDGRALHCARLAAPHVETSNGFDPAGVARARGASFGRLAARLRRLDGARWRTALLAWHRRHLDAAGGAAARRRSVCVHGLRVRTVSSTLVEVGPAGVSMRYQPGPPCRGFPGVELAP